MDSILLERLLALVRPAFGSLKRCVQACGCKIVTPRYAPQFGSRLHFKQCQALPKETPFPFFSGTLFFWNPLFSFFVFFLGFLPTSLGHGGASALQTCLAAPMGATSSPIFFSLAALGLVASVGRLETYPCTRVELNPGNCLTLVRRPTPFPSHHGVVSTSFPSWPASGAAASLSQKVTNARMSFVKGAPR